MVLVYYVGYSVCSVWLGRNKIRLSVNKGSEREFAMKAAKRQVAEAAVELIEDGMVVGLGSGSTARIFVELLGQKIRAGELKDIVGIATSKATAKQAKALEIRQGNLSDYSKLDIAIDGADEVDPNLNLVKGWGGALVREKLVEIYAERLVIVVDESKLVGCLGTHGPLPVEVTQFAWQTQAKWLADTLECEVRRRMAEEKPYLTDNMNFILCCDFADGIADPYTVRRHLMIDRPGLVGHGLFLDMATDVLVSTGSGVKRLQRSR